MSAFAATVRSNRRLAFAVFDTSAWLIGYFVFSVMRFNLESDRVPWGPLAVVAVGTAALHVAIARLSQLHQGRARIASLDEMLLLAEVVATTTLVTFVANLPFVYVPRSEPVGAGLVALVIMAWGRAAWRRLNERDDERRDYDDSRRVLIVGAGEAGRELLSSMLRDPQRKWQPVGFLDDDPAKRLLRIRQIPVVGTARQLAAKAAEYDVRTVVLALPSASAETIESLRITARDADLKVKVLPATTQLLDNHVGIRDLRDINLTDVLGRHQLDTDIGAIAGYLTGRRVLVTGAGGSIGSELCRQIHRFAPAELMMLDRDESALHALQLSIHGRALLDSNEVILCDIRDAATVRGIFAARRPDVVFHAAALKHLPMLEQYPAEAVKTNIIGTRNVLDAAELVDVDRFVNVSTDKAANPCSVLGYSKRVAECLTAYRARRVDGSYLSVRFGNVLGSRGSALTSFAKQIAEGGPVTVTHPEVSRYFMTIEEACQLVVQAAAIGDPGEALVLDMGDPVSIVDVARQLIEQSEEDIRIEFTGLRDGEKLHEELFGDEEPRDDRRVHPLVSHVPVPDLSDDDINRLPSAGPAVAVREAMREMCADASERSYSDSGNARR